MKQTITIVLLLAVFALSSCRPATPVPKPKGYYRIELPAHAYQVFDSAGYPFSFEYPVYGIITRDAQLNKEENAPYWMNVEVPELGAAIYISYKHITPQETLEKLTEESYKLSYAHDIRADYIKTPEFRTANGLSGVYYYVGGNAASSYQFFITDRKEHFVRGSLYFNTAPNVDSLRPALDFLKKDMEHLAETIRFRNQ